MQRPVPALIDALQHEPNRTRGSALIAAIVQQRIATGASVRLAIAAERTLPGRRLYAAIAGDVEGGAHSLAELDLAPLARRAGLPPPRRQARRRDSAGRVRYLDADFDGFCAEVDGAVHLRPLNWWADQLRQNDIVIAGKPVLRFAAATVRLQPDVVVQQLKAAARRWPPSA